MNPLTKPACSPDCQKQVARTLEAIGLVTDARLDEINARLTRLEEKAEERPHG